MSITMAVAWFAVLAMLAIAALDLKSTKTLK